jgi:transcriptional regulator with XRE-family HTH domain
MLSDVVAERIKRYREQRGMRRSDLASRCAELGWPALTESAIGNVETGRRGEDGTRRRLVAIDKPVFRIGRRHEHP